MQALNSPAEASPSVKRPAAPDIAARARGRKSPTSPPGRTAPTDDSGLFLLLSRKSEWPNYGPRAAVSKGIYADAWLNARGASERVHERDEKHEKKSRRNGTCEDRKGQRMARIETNEDHGLWSYSLRFARFVGPSDFRPFVFFVSFVDQNSGS